MNGGIVHAHADATALHRADELEARQTHVPQRQQRREDMPAVPVVAAGRQAHWRGSVPALKVARDEPAPRRIEFLQAGHLPQADARGNVRQVGLTASERDVKLIHR